MPSQPAPVPPDDLSRKLTVARPDTDQGLPHIGLVGDTYTILVTGAETAGKYTLIDMYVPPGGGPPPHRHDFEEMFTVLDGEVLVTFRGQTLVARAGETVNVPANAPHAFTNAGDAPSRLLCMCAPSGQGRRSSSHPSSGLLASLQGPASRGAACLGGRGPAEGAEGTGQVREVGAGQRGPQQAVELVVEDGAGDAQEFGALGGQFHDR
jgi:quercetin dioxygenase-like cupin family protein